MVGSKKWGKCIIWNLFKSKIKDLAIPFVSIAAVVITFIIWYYSKGAPGIPKGQPGILGDYRFGFELIILNSLLTFILLIAVSKINSLRNT